MSEIWSGDILLPDNNAIRDVILTSHANSASSPRIPALNLRFLAVVDTARVPLYLATGPSLDVYTTSEETQDWFEETLLSEPSSKLAREHEAVSHEWFTCARAQSPIGILVQAQDAGDQDGNAPRVTEILFYGTIAVSTGTIPTPPASSQELLGAPYEELPELKVHALPLSSDLLHRSNPVLADPAPTTDAPTEPQFLPAPFFQTPTESSTPKRKRDIFEESIQLVKKAKRKGGQGISAAAAKASKNADSQPPLIHRRSISISSDAKSLPFSEPRPRSAGGPLARPSSRRSSRSPSVSSDTHPFGSKKPSEGQGRKSALSKVETVPLKPETETQEPTTETRNKEALSRVVLAAMRMHGLQQRKKNRCRRASIAPGASAADAATSEEKEAEEAAKDEEYKLIYHQTYKGAALALRKHIATESLHQHPDKLEDIVEQLLTIFLTDPLAPSPPPPVLQTPMEELTNPLATAGALGTPGAFATPGHARIGLGVPGSTHGRAGRPSPFDMPSAKRMGMSIAMQAGGTTRVDEVNTGSPVRSRRKVEKEKDEDKEKKTVSEVKSSEPGGGEG